MPSYYCDRCRTSRGWQGFHVCFDASKPEPNTPVKEKKPVETTRFNMSESQTERRAREREAVRSRDLEIVRTYNEEQVSTSTLRRMFGVSQHTVLRILHEAEEEGRTVVRARGHTLAMGAK